MLRRANAGGANLPVPMVAIFEALCGKDQEQFPTFIDDTTDKELDRVLFVPD